jgi:5-formyltetrahydrofolate cyclo-ligase
MNSGGSYRMDIETKKDIREQILKYRESLDLNIRGQWDESIFDKLIKSEFYKNAKTIFAFVSFKSEVDTHKIIKYAIQDQKTICVPKIKSKETGIEIFKINTFDELKKGYFSILEPLESCPSIDSNDLDLILMPGVAFDRKGGRLGYGAAFYDRFLTGMNKAVDKIALAYHFQVIDNIPMDEHDVRIDGVITEKEIIVANKKIIS